MKHYSVTWWQAAKDELARLWLESDNRASITGATNDVDRILSTDPLSEGIMLHEGLRRLIVGPLRVLYEVKEEDRVVTVWTVGLSDKGVGDG